MRNKHKVPKHQWIKWGPTSQYVFNRVYESTVDGEGFIGKEDADTLIWNAAFEAACAVKDKAGKI